jgi:catechol 2,3-dioxygenase-like lactoylglutathione lyase family enzyme
MRMMKEEVTSILGKLGARLDHIGILSDNLEESIAYLNRLPRLGEFEILPEAGFNRDILRVGAPYAIRIAIASFSDNPVRLEILSPVREKTTPGCIYIEHLDKYGAGLHHFAYDFPDEESYHSAVKIFTDAGDKIILEGRVEPHTTQSIPGGIEFVYLEPANGCGCFIEFKIDPLG